MYDEGLEQVFHDKIREAFTGGMSVIEIANIFRHRRVEFVHGVLRNAGLIPHMPKDEYHRRYEIDVRLQNELRKKGYSFGRWCLSWKFDPTEATLSLQKPPDEGITAVHKALCRDFPETYSEMYGEATSPKKIWSIASEFEKLSVSITWDKIQKRYIAQVVESPEIVGDGINWDDALQNMKQVNRLQRHIKRLELATAGMLATESERGLTQPPP
ncbi:MAG: hypothetical protein A2512_09995 [Deltaproteobacteria bacterium RIFOXYD12_FULL_56_24]|nr:MAG: hypothetical protein A2512_09995 [Deltaproteobacteria bacterium RIFOXYD12_FULL_56_24]